jgi:hypothetical protein
MTGEPGAPRPVAHVGAQGPDIRGFEGRERDAVLAWVGENLTLVRRSAFGQRILYWSLGIGFAVGLAARGCQIISTWRAAAARALGRHHDLELRRVGLRSSLAP